MVMMYISVLPIAISMRRTNVYEEKSLGIYSEINPDGDSGSGAEPSYIGAHLRRQLSFDLWYVFLGLFLIAIIEGRRLENTNEYAFTLYSVLFEIISAYGTVGLSLGYPTANTSFSGQFTTLSKLVMIAMQIRGRHRGLPYELDRAVLLPSESLQRKEAVEARKMALRRRTSLAAYSQLDLDNPRTTQSHPNPVGGLGNTPYTPYSPVTGPGQGPSIGAGISSADMARIPTAGLDEAASRDANRLPTVPEDVGSPEIRAADGSLPSGSNHVRSGLGNAIFKLASAGKTSGEAKRD